ncbi:MAG: hypothetical protein FD123_648 [Bacteroidetes bacterium]|nr:MAG: hypothetical protein FD123_648 [Bacteroidota bacterium]
MNTARTLLLFLSVFVIHSFCAAQDLAFLGIPDVRFGMHTDSLKGKLAVLDTSSAYRDTATYLRNTRCVIWVRPQEKLDITGFTASRIEYEFCDKRLYYAFFKVKGTENVEKALAQLKKDFPNAGCKQDGPLSNCNAFDTSNKKFRIIATIKNKGTELEFVLVPKRLKF